MKARSQQVKIFATTVSRKQPIWFHTFHTAVAILKSFMVF